MPKKSKKSKASKSIGGFSVVGIGASAGGLESIAQILTELPSNTGMAFIIVQHLDPKHDSMSTEILSRKTTMRVAEASDGLLVRADHIYVIPPNRDLIITGGKLKLSLRVDVHGQNLPINLFFESLALDLGSRAIGVILSGHATDGTLGLEAIKTAGGVTLAQDPESAKFAGMPTSAIASGVVDHILSPDEIAHALTRLALHPGAEIQRQDWDSATSPKGDAAFLKIITLLRTLFHVDFDHYKQNTLKRRITRRMTMNKISAIEDYADFAEAHADEARALFEDMLINVTEFFRDQEAFAELGARIFPSISEAKTADSPIRIWSVGCASGEEPYSIAISLLEYLGDAAVKHRIQIFATDLSESAISKARIGMFPLSISSRVNEARLKNYFSKTTSGYRINKTIRDMCLFSRHDVTRDPPFAKLDLICCRNVLIYFEPILQKRVLPIFHYALNSHGYLWLGRSETVGESSVIFATADNTQKFYSRKSVPTNSKMSFWSSPLTHESARQGLYEQAPFALDIQRESDRVALAHYAPAAVVVNEDMDIVLTRGVTDPYLKFSPGVASLNIFKLIHPDLMADVRVALQQSRKDSAPVRKDHVEYREGDQVRVMNLQVIPLQKLVTDKMWFFSVNFEHAGVSVEGVVTELGQSSALKTKSHSLLSKMRLKLKKLEQDLDEARAYQQSTAEEFEETKEELISANEELQTTSEEYQSTNEELETAKEELQSSNEELGTVNNELQTRNSDLASLNIDLNNFMECVDIPLVMVDREQKIRRFTSKAGEMMNLISSDLGRSIGDIKPSLEINDLSATVAEVMSTAEDKEFEVKSRRGHWFRLQVKPYRSVGDRVDGAVIALVDIDLLKRDLKERGKALMYARAVADAVRLPMAVLNERLEVQSVNSAFCELFQRDENLTGKDIVFLTTTSGKRAFLKTAIETAISTEQKIRSLEIETVFSDIGHRVFHFSTEVIKWAGLETKPLAILLSIDDVTDRKLLSDERDVLLVREQSARAEAERANQSKDAFLATLSHELRTPLTAILSWAQLVQRQNLPPEKLQLGYETIERNAKLQGQLIDDLLDIARIQAGKLALNMLALDPGAVVCEAVRSVSLMAEAKAISIDVNIAANQLWVRADAHRLQQVVWNLLTNAIKFSSEGQTIFVQVETVTQNNGVFVSIKVTDHGKGIKAEFLDTIFGRFVQVDSSAARVHGGLGLGLSIVHDLIKLQNGTVRAESDGEGLGATFTILLAAQVDSESSVKVLDASASMGKFVAQSFQPDLKGICVLVVEDEASSLDALAETLGSFGASTVPCSSADQAMTALQSSKAAIIISDIAMPGQDGYSLMKAIRKLPPERGGRIPALALTAYASKEDIDAATAAGFDAHMSKPYDISVLASMVLSLIGRVVGKD